MTRADAGMVAKLLYGRSDAPPATRTGAAGLRTLWQTTYDEHLTLTVALFTERPARRARRRPCPHPSVHGGEPFAVRLRGRRRGTIGTAEGHDPAAEPNPGLPTGQTKPILATR